MNTSELNYPPGKFVSVYVTAKRRHSSMLLGLRTLWPQLYFTGRWPIVRDIASEQIRPASHWMQDNADDAARAQVFVGFAEPEDVLSTSIFEIGAAWNRGQLIFLVGQNEGYKEWTFATGIRRFATMDDALHQAMELIRYGKTDRDIILEAVGKLREDVDRIGKSQYPDRVGTGTQTA